MDDQSVLSQLLDPANIEVLRTDVERWQQILNKKTVNVILVGKRPDQSVDTTRRDGLLRVLMVLEALLEQHKKSLPASAQPAAPTAELAPDPLTPGGGE